MKRFSHFKNAKNTNGFTVTLARSGQSIFVPPGSSILYVLLNAGVDVRFNCGDGKCGVCEVGVLEGIPDHHDSRLTSGKKAGNDSVMICCSGSITSELVLDL